MPRRTLTVLLTQLIVSAAFGALLMGCSVKNLGALKAATLNSGIVDGKQATGDEDFSKTIVLLYDKSFGSICTASIISDKLLLTAAHCVSSPVTSLRVVFGTDLHSTDIIVRRVVVTQVTPVWPARMAQQYNEGDMAIVGFVDGLPAGYKAAEMLSDASQLKDGQTVTLAGYGTEDGISDDTAGILRYADSTIKQAAYTESEILVDGSNGHGACHGDSGGPAYINVNGKRLLVGVTSHGVNDPHDICTVAATYTSTSYFADWIKTTAADLSGQVDQFTEARKQAQAKQNAEPAPITPAIPAGALAI